MYRFTPVAMMILLAVTFVGFYPTFFSKISDAKATHLIHGITSTLWIVMLGVQAKLIDVRRRGLHRMLGIVSLLVVPLMVAGFALINLDAAVRATIGESVFDRTYAGPLLVIDVIFLISTLGFIYLALAKRRCRRSHAAYMILTSFALISPSFARLLVNYLPWLQITGPQEIHHFGIALWLSFAVTILLLVGIYARVSTEKSAWLIGITVYALAIVLYATLGQTVYWFQWVQWMAGLNYSVVFVCTLIVSSGVLYVGWTRGTGVQAQRPTTESTLNQ